MTIKCRDTPVSAVTPGGVISLRNQSLAGTAPVTAHIAPSIISPLLLAAGGYLPDIQIGKNTCVNNRCIIYNIYSMSHLLR